MRAALIFLIAFVIFSCDTGRVHERNYDFENRAWLATNQPNFEFDVTDTVKTYNLYCNIRNSMDYPYSRLYINYALTDSAGTAVSNNMIQAFLFEEKTGRPLGSSGLGNVYDHQVPVLKDFRFKKPGPYNLRFEQFMRNDTLKGVLAIGFRLELAATE